MADAEGSWGWASYLAGFHRDHPGITEDVLALATDRSATPYAWLSEPIADVAGVVIDIACGSGPLAPLLPRAGWVGVDRSTAELRRARSSNVTAVAQGDAARLPVRSASAAAVVCSMALMILEPLDSVLDEAARLLLPGGLLVALVTAESPLSAGDRLRYAQLLWVLRRRRLDYPNRKALARPADRLAPHGLELLSDERRRFGYPLDEPGRAATLVRSLYLPGVAPERILAGVRTARRWRGRDIGIPLRRLVARRDDSNTSGSPGSP